MMKKSLSLSLLLVLSLTLSACTNSKTTPPAEVETPIPAQPTTQYDQNSWKELIPADCKAFFDGCNNCQQMPEGDAACTRMFCENYKEPKCLDAETPTMHPSWDANGDGTNDCEKDDTCDNSIDYTQPKPSLASDYIGLSVEESQTLAKSKNTPFRVVERDGEPLPATMDWRPGRLNASVADDIVVGIQVEGQEK